MLVLNMSFRKHIGSTLRLHRLGMRHFCVSHVKDSYDGTDSRLSSLSVMVHHHSVVGFDLIYPFLHSKNALKSGFDSVHCLTNIFQLFHDILISVTDTFALQAWSCLQKALLLALCWSLVFTNKWYISKRATYTMYCLWRK